MNSTFKQGARSTSGAVWPRVGRLLGGLLISGTAVWACSDPASPAGYKEYAAGKSGSAGSSSSGGMASGGKGAMPAEGGDSIGGAGDGGDAPSQMGGGAGKGGGAGGKAGSGGGGKGGGPGTACGNGMTEAGEQCDDGNNLDFDGCSSVCKKKCESCLDEFYGGDPDYQAYVAFCTSATAVAEEGPAAGQPRSKLCQKLVRCIHESECWKDPKGIWDACYCGGVSNVDCDAGKGTGPCIEEYGAAAESKSPTEIHDARLTNLTLGVGWAMLLVQLEAYNGYCAAACKEERDVTPCERCLAGDDHPLEAPTAGCTACLTDAICSPALVSCVNERCSDGNLEPCLGKSSAPDEQATSGPCKEAIAANESLFPVTADALRCQATQCKAECFKP